MSISYWTLGGVGRRPPFSAFFRDGRGPGPSLLFSRARLRRESLPITAFRLTPISAAISRQDSPASKRIFRSSRRSVVHVRSLAGMFDGPQVTADQILLALFCLIPSRVLYGALPLSRPLSRIDSSPSLMASRIPSSIRVFATPGTLVPWVPCLTSFSR